MNLKLVILYCFITTALISQTSGNSFLDLAADSVVFYDFAGHAKEGMSIIDKNGHLVLTVKKIAKLNVGESNTFTRLLSDKSSFGNGTASCFDPHLGVVYYKNKKPAAYINICLDCNRLYPSLELKAQLQGKQQEGKDIYYIQDGMSKKFRVEINLLLKKYNFSHQIPEESLFDK